MASLSARLIAVVGVLALAGGLRVVHLGTWSFALDEGPTIAEADNLLDGRPLDDTQATRLPRMVPVSYALHGLAYRHLGKTEGAARVPAAVAGTLLCGLAVLGLWAVLGGWGATAAGLLLAVNPESVLHSQNNRFYIEAALFAVGACVATAAALRTRSPGWMLVAVGCVLVGTLTQTLVAGLAAGLVASAVLAPTGDTRNRGLLIAVAVLGAAAVGAVGWFYVMPLAKGWNAGSSWAYGIPQAVLAGMNGLGWPVAVLFGVGAVLLATGRDPWRWFWLVWAGGWAAALVVLPKAVPYHPEYGFVFQFGPLAVAAAGVGLIARRLVDGGYGRWAAAGWVAAATVLNLPALASHHVDGSRPDQRAAANFIADHRSPGEGVYAVSSMYLKLYRPAELGDAAPLAFSDADMLKQLQEIAGRGGSWVVVPSGRGGIPADRPKVAAWLNENGRLKASFRKKRLDYYEFGLDVYRIGPG